jgi:Lysyl oxidase
MKIVMLIVIIAAAIHIAQAAKCGPDDVGALTETTAPSLTVAVSLSEFPLAYRDEAAAYYLRQGDDFWEARAKRQILLSNYRLIYRRFYYEDGQGSLPLAPKDAWDVDFTSAAARAMYDGFDVVSRTYDFKSVIVSICEDGFGGPGNSEPLLAEVGGTWTEVIELPIDPDLLIQRTGYACMDEVDWPVDTPFSYNSFVFYDHECGGVEDTDCHISTHIPRSSQLPALVDCVTALTKLVGRSTMRLKFTRLDYDKSIADRYRVGAQSDLNGADLEVLTDGLERNFVVHKFFEPEDCSLAEGCIAAPGWRRLLTFDAAVANQARDDLAVGTAAEGHSNVINGLFEYGECHDHWHFSYYGDFRLHSEEHKLFGLKQAFCMQSTDRYNNNEYVPTRTRYDGCEEQGITAGWGDAYVAHLDCQWVDVTDLEDVDREELEFEVNPADFICEGIAVLDNEGEIVYEEEVSGFKTDGGKDVHRPRCNFHQGYADNNAKSIYLDIKPSRGFIHEECELGEQGPLRDCGWKEAFTGQRQAGRHDDTNVAWQCTQGASTSFKVRLANEDARPQLLRVCEHSRSLGHGIACQWTDALANIIVNGTTDVEVSFTCPSSRSTTETGGLVHFYQAPLLRDDDSRRRDDHFEDLVVTEIDQTTAGSPRYFDDDDDDSAASALNSIGILALIALVAIYFQV